MHWIKEITQLILSLVQLVAALSLIGLIIAPPLTNGLNQLKTEIWGRQITLDATVTDRRGNPVPNVTVTVVQWFDFESPKGAPDRGPLGAEALEGVMDPDCTGGLGSVEYVRHLRDACE